MYLMYCVYLGAAVTSATSAICTDNVGEQC